ncbi:hypothetical protein BY458DRAFT_546748 [Sporodiniella umbellata]|nr:hypothetical protein BY458DRAFT_546748 [Sporodiniella umbellata]
MVWKYTDLFDNKTIISFGKWYANKFFEYCLSVLIRFSDDIAKKVLDYLPNYQLPIQSLKNKKKNIVGYARKSRTNVNDESRIWLLQQGASRLKGRSLVDKIFVSLCANANELMVEKDFIKNDDLLEKLTVNVDAQVYYDVSKVGVLQRILRFQPISCFKTTEGKQKKPLALLMICRISHEQGLATASELSNTKDFQDRS